MQLSDLFNIKNLNNNLPSIK